jgi:hypothetical protein
VEQSRRRIVHAQRAGITPQSELAVLSAIYAFVLRCHERKAGVAPAGEDDTRRDKNACTAEEKYTQI